VWLKVVWERYYASAVDMSGTVGAKEASGGISGEDISLRELEEDGTETERKALVDRQEVARHTNV